MTKYNDNDPFIFIARWVGIAVCLMMAFWYLTIPKDMGVQAGICIIASAMWYIGIQGGKAYGILLCIGSVIAYLFLNGWLALFTILVLILALASIHSTIEMKEMRKRKGIEAFL